MNDCSHLVNGPCQCAASVAARANDEARKHAAEPYAVGLGVKFNGPGIRAAGAYATNAGLEQMGRSVHEPEHLRIALDKEQCVTSGFYGPSGHIPYPGLAACGKTYAEWLVDVKAGVAIGVSTATRTFTRQEVLTVIKALSVQDFSPDPDVIFARLISTFERME